MKKYNRKTGKIGESAAKEYLMKKGFEIVERNYSTRFGEIDLICKDKNILVFVEVKTKKGMDFGTPEEMFTRKKYNRVKRMATIYLDGKEVPCRIDMVAVELDSDNQSVEVRHYEGVSL
jgi:putative endonuclease